MTVLTAKKAFYVYAITDPQGKQYIGLTKNYKRRWKGHLNGAFTGSASRATLGLYSMIKKYGEDKLRFRVIAVLQTQEEGCRIEQELIKVWNTLSPAGYNLQSGGLNYEISEPLRNHLKDTWTDNRRKKASAYFTGTGNPQFGKKASETLIRKLSESHKGIIRTAEWRHNLSVSLRGKNKSPEHRKHLSEAHKGKKQTEEHKMKNSQANSGERNHMFGRHHTEQTKQLLRCLNTGKRQTKETCEKISRSQTGRVHTEETKRKMSISRSSYWKRKKGEQ